MDSDRVIPLRFDFKHFERRLIHLERAARLGRLGVVALLGLGAVSTRAARARTFIAQIGERVLAVVIVLPVNVNALGFRDRDMLGFGLNIDHERLIPA